MNKQIIIDYEEYLTLEHINKIHMNEMNKLKNCVVIPEEEYEKLKQENKELKEQLENASNNYTKYIQERDNKIDKAIELLNQYLKDWDNSYLIKEDLNTIRCVLKDSDIDDNR